MSQQSIIEKSVALSGYDYLINKEEITTSAVKNVVVSVATSYGQPYVEKYTGQVIDTNQRLVLSSLTTAVGLYAYDYVQKEGLSSYLEYLKKGFASEILVMLYRNMRSTK